MKRDNDRPILITGFEPFAGMKRNPSEAVVNAVAKSFSSENVISEILPVEYHRAGKIVSELILRNLPAAWIGFGLSQRANAVTLERAAVKLGRCIHCRQLRRPPEEMLH